MVEKVTLEMLANWDSPDSEFFFDVHLEQYFRESFGQRDWLEISDEGVRVLNAMFEMEIEKDSPIEHVISAISCQAAHGAFQAVADALGVDSDDLEVAAAAWYEPDSERPPAVGWEGIKEIIRDDREERKGE